MPWLPASVKGPGDMGILGFWVAHCLGIPLVASWHTNLHEYAGRRLDKLFSPIPDRWRERISSAAERQSLRACVSFYRLARFLFAPNQGMVDLLGERQRSREISVPRRMLTPTHLSSHSATVRGRKARLARASAAGELESVRELALT